MFYDAIERSYTVIDANFATDMAAIVTAKSETVVATTATVYKRRIGSGLAEDDTTAIAIYAITSTTDSKRQGRRDGRINMVWEYWCYGTDPDVVSITVELAIEALLMSIDKLIGGDSVMGAGEREGSVIVDPSNLAKLDGSDLYEDFCRIRFPIVDRDEVT